MKKSLLVKLLVLNLSAFLIQKPAHGQSEVVGFVKSSITGLKPITDVVVEVVNLKKPITERIKKTDSLGFFRLENLEANKKYVLKVTAYGYGKQVFEINTEPGITETVLTLKAGCDFDKVQAENDWKSGVPKLLLVGSVAPVANTRADLRFEKKFGIRYHDFGCSPVIGECIKAYNERIFQLLDQQYGKSWRKKVRVDTEYLN